MLLAHLFGVKTLYPDPTMYECTGTKDEFYPNLGIGLLYLLLGITYIPCVIVMNQPPLRSMPCFKVMIYMGVVDVACLFICADLAGIWQITGQTYCHSPSFAYISGNLAMVICGSLAYRIWKKKSNKISAMTRQIIYIPCIIAMTQPPLRSMFCFKIMG
ncbi:hypothetical protein ANCCEY_02681 [Ancylostoma ceylanicum]|uniref:Uncharacterized protein n=1 Tax=Ancylostoma ceylanicum TaxID=53326 RepID=A0A0D6M3Y4_9BILA|nr:hypothetical protein ANCCEY_02681 [Ancylostoma ceylanicum]